MMWNKDDPRWSTLLGGYRVIFDPRPLIRRLESAPDDDEIWDSLIQELYHQGDVGEASYVAVCLLAQSNAITKAFPWQLLAIAAFVELARTAPGNPLVPDWLLPDYLGVIETLARLSLKALETAESPEQQRGMLSIMALHKGFRVYARMLADYSEDELREFLILSKTQVD